MHNAIEVDAISGKSEFHRAMPSGEELTDIESKHNRSVRSERRDSTE
jgi:hypothetical protein